MISSGSQDDDLGSELSFEAITFDDIRRHKNARHDSESDDGDTSHLLPDYKFFSVVMGSKRKKLNSLSDKQSKQRLAWKNAILKALAHGDPWEKFHLEAHPSEKALRYRYNALQKTWVTDDVLVKMEKEPFSHGAMRACYRMKKLSNFSHSACWKKDSNNYVAKRYVKSVDRNTYFEDVKLQMDAKLWGEEFNRHNPPKKVDIFQMAVLQFVDRKDKPLYHVEHFIEGDYIKYNSNSGFVLGKDEAARQTPQAFSHFTFERSGHELIVVDVQGVGDLYTDPQIHTAEGSEYGDGNLGTRGMALFFHSHICNSICESLNLSRFDRAPSELDDLRIYINAQKDSKTRVRGSEEVCVLPSEYERTHLSEFLRMRSDSSGYISNSPPLSPEIFSDSEEPYRFSFTENSEDDSENNGRPRKTKSEDSVFSRSHSRISSDSLSRSAEDFSSFEEKIPVKTPRSSHRLISEGSGSVTDEADKLAFSRLMERRARPSCVEHELVIRRNRRDSEQKTGGSRLGQIHMDLAKYHELCRFTDPDSTTYDKKAALFHLQHAADCGVLEAIITIARIYLQLPHDILPDLEVSDTTDNVDVGIDYMIQAADAGDRAAMVYVAKAFDTGVGLGSRQQSWKQAVLWYERVTSMDEADEEGHWDGTMDDPSYLLLAREAELYQNGGYDLEKDPNRAGELFTAAAESAMVCMKGRLATNYYMKAEEAWGECEE